MISRRSALIVCALFSLCLSGRAQTRYNLVDLGAFAGGSSTATSINNAGQIVGWSTTVLNDFTQPEVRRHAFIWDSLGGLQDLGTFGGDYSEAHAINEEGHVVGWASRYPFIDIVLNQEPFRWSPLEGMQVVNTNSTDYIHWGAGLGQATGINAKGKITGFENVNDPANGFPLHGFLWSPETGIEDIGVPQGGYYVLPEAINASEQIVGFAAGRDLGFYGFLWDRTVGFRPLVPLPTGNVAGPGAINDHGTIVGGSDLLDPDFGFNVFHAVIWTDPSHPHDLGTLPYGFYSSANSINRKGKIVGASGSSSVDRNATPLNHGTLWDSSGRIQDLNWQIPVRQGWYLSAANAINDRGQIAAQLTRMVGYPPDTHAVLLTPARSPTAVATDVTTRIRVSRSEFEQTGPTQFTQVVRLENTGSKDIAGPIRLVLDNLSLFVTPEDLSGYTNYVAPLASPYRIVNLSAANALRPGAFTTLPVTLDADPGLLGWFSNLDYTVRLLAGPGAP